MQSDNYLGYVKLKVHLKDGTQNYKIKKFPFYLGNEKASDVIYIQEGKIDGRQCKIDLLKDGLYFYDLSNSGSLVNHKVIKQEYTKLPSGFSSINIGGVDIQIENGLNVLHQKLKYNSKPLWIGPIIGVIIVIAVLSIFLLGRKSGYTVSKKLSKSVKPVEAVNTKRIDANIFNWKINPADKKVKIKRGQGKAKVIIQLKNGVSNNKKYYLRISGDDGEHATNDTYFIQKIQVPLSFTQKGTRPVTFTIVSENSNTCDTTFTFYVIKPKIDFDVKAKILAGAIVKIVGYKDYRKKISKIIWGDGKTKKEQRHTYKNILSIPDHITIIDNEGNKHRISIKK